MPSPIEDGPVTPFMAGPFYIVSVMSGYVVEVLSGAMADGTWLVTAARRTTSDGKSGSPGYFPTQVWTAVATTSPYWRITSQADSQYAIAIKNNGTDSNTTVVIAKIADGPVPDGQQWLLAPAPGGGFMLASKLIATSGTDRLVMDIESASFAPGATIKSKIISTDTTQLWVTAAFVPPQTGL
jgi:Ricin-type beta-trefoil lectin domain-like